MGGSSKQTVGFKYFAGMQVAIGNCIEQLLNINPDKRGWIFSKPEEIAQLKLGDTSMVVNKPDLFGGDKQEGGWVGTIDIHTGQDSGLRQNSYLAANDSELVSSFPGLSHLIFRGNNLDQGFQLVSMSGMLKEVLYWPKRTRIKDDGSEQWYREYFNTDKQQIIVVCEIESQDDNSSIIVDPKPVDLVTVNSSCNWSQCSAPEEIKELDYDVEFSEVIVAGDQEGTLPLATSSCDFGGATTDKSFIGNFSINFGGEGLLKVVFSAGMGNVGDRPFRPSDFNFSCNQSFEPIVIGRTVYWEVTAKLPANIIGSITCHLYPEDEGGFFFNHRIYPARFHQAPFKEQSANSIGYDINPIHQIREIITNDTAMNKPEAMINDENFKFAARRIWDEGLGVSGAFTEKSCKEAIDELLYHIEAGARLNRQTGQYEIILFRDDLLELESAMVFDKSNIKTFSIEIANVDDVINSVNVNYYDRFNIKDSAFSLDEIGSVMSSEVNAQTLDFPYFMNRKNAELVGNWKLKQLSTPTRKGTFKTGKYDARKINKYEVVKLTWQNQNMFEVPVRIMKIGLGDGRDNTVSLDWVEVIPYSSTIFPTINVDPPTSVVLPPQPNQSIVFEMPYFEAVQRFGQTQVDAELANNPDLGYLVVATKKPQSNSINALLYTDDVTGYQQASIVDYCPVATLDQEISYLDTSFAVKNVASISQAEVGSLILCDEELMVYQSYDTETKILTVKRAALDTVPKPHSQDAVFYFYDAFNTFDSEQYVLSEVINAKVLTTTPSGILGMEEATELSLEMDARPNRPYPPANVKINSEYYPAEIETDLVVTWVDRNRLQQTGGSILGWTDGGVALESGAATMLIIKELDDAKAVIATHNVNATGTNTYTLPISSMQAETRFVDVTAKTVRDGYDSYQYFNHVVELSNFFTAPYDIQFTVRKL